MDFLEFLSDNGSHAVLEAKEHLFRQGEVSPKFAYVRKGILKAYYLTYEGKEFIKSFICEGDVIGSIRSASEKGPSPFGLLALERCELVTFDFDCLLSAAVSDLPLARHAIASLMQFAMKKERREHEFLVLSPEDRYASLKLRSPELLQRVTQGDIARYLGVTPVALSRIRRRMASK